MRSWASWRAASGKDEGGTRLRWFEKTVEVGRLNWERLFFFFLDFFLMWTILKVFIEFATILLLFYVLVFLAARHVGS